MMANVPGINRYAHDAAAALAQDTSATPTRSLLDGTRLSHRDLISEFERPTGVAVVNTSFNLW